MSRPRALARGAVVWVRFDPAAGRRGVRPALVVSSAGYLGSVRDLVVVLPLTSVDRGWPHHVPVEGVELPKRGYVMTEQPRTIRRDQVTRQSGVTDAATMSAVDGWLRDFLEA